jgi:hypothetical protein
VSRHHLEPHLDDRRLTAAGTGAVRALPPDVAWIAKTWSGPAGLAASGHGWGAFQDGDLVAVACTFFAGARYHELGVATAPGHLRRDAGSCLHVCC